MMTSMSKNGCGRTGGYCSNVSERALTGRLNATVTQSAPAPARY